MSTAPAQPGPGRLVLARRTALGGTLALVATACTGSPPRAGDPAPARTLSGPSASAPASPEPAAVAPDVRLAAAAAAAVTQAADLVRRSRARHPVLRSPLQPLAATHTGHAAFLAGALEQAASPDGVPREVRVPADAGRALAEVRAGTERLRLALAELAVRSRSGRFARALASMSASMAQHLAELPEAPPGRGARAASLGAAGQGGAR